MLGRAMAAARLRISSSEELYVTYSQAGFDGLFAGPVRRMVTVDGVSERIFLILRLRTAFSVAVNGYVQ